MNPFPCERDVGHARSAFRSTFERVPYRFLDSALILLMLAGIEPGEAMQVLNDPRPRWPVPMAHPSGLPMLAIWGRTRTGRPLVSAYYLTCRSAYDLTCRSVFGELWSYSS